MERRLHFRVCYPERERFAFKFAISPGTPRNFSRVRLRGPVALAQISRGIIGALLQCFKSLDVSEDPFELIEAVVAHDQFAFSRRGMLEGHLGAQFVRELELEAANIGIG